MIALNVVKRRVHVQLKQTDDKLYMINITVELEKLLLIREQFDA